MNSVDDLTDTITEFKFNNVDQTLLFPYVEIQSSAAGSLCTEIVQDNIVTHRETEYVYKIYKHMHT